MQSFKHFIEVIEAQLNDVPHFVCSRSSLVPRTLGISQVTDSAHTHTHTQSCTCRYRGRLDVETLTLDKMCRKDSSHLMVHCNRSSECDNTAEDKAMSENDN